MNAIERVLSGALGRWIRAAIATAISGWVAHHQGNEWYISLSPFIQAVFKKLRDKYPGVWEWVPL